MIYFPTLFEWKGMDLQVYYDPEDCSLISVTNQENEQFLEMMAEYYQTALQDDFIKFKEGRDYEEAEKLTALDNERML